MKLRRIPFKTVTVLALMTVLSLSAVSFAAQRDNDRRGPAIDVVVNPGYVVRALPRNNVRIDVRNRPFFYQSGIFYEQRGRDYVVVSAPIGARVRALPPGFIRIGLGGRDYFYFNATFYLWDEPTSEYVVVEEPSGADAALTEVDDEQTADTSPLYVYPAGGQTSEQTQQDRYECHVWASDETQFDPSMGDTDAQANADYRRALSACLEGRGYTVR